MSPRRRSPCPRPPPPKPLRRPAARAITGDRELSQRAPPCAARLLLEHDAPDLIRRGHDGRDAPAASRTRDPSFERIDDVLDPLVDLVDIERPVAEYQRDPDLQLIALPIPHTSARLHVEDRSMHPPPPLIARARVCGERDRDREPPGHAGTLAPSTRG